MSYYDHATLLAMRLGPWAGHEPPKHCAPRRGEDKRREVEASQRLLRFLPSAKRLNVLRRGRLKT